jgi:hypothetical protein
LPPGARIAQRVVFGGDYEDGRRVHSTEPSSACARPDRPVTALRRPEHVPSASRSLPKSAGKSNFSRSMAVLSRTNTSCRCPMGHTPDSRTISNTWSEQPPATTRSLTVSSSNAAVAPSASPAICASRPPPRHRGRRY